MTTQHATTGYGANDTDDLVRSVALSSAKLWEEVLERLVRVEQMQGELARTVAQLRAELPSGPQAAAVGPGTPALAPPPPPPGFVVPSDAAIPRETGIDAAPPPPPGMTAMVVGASAGLIGGAPEPLSYLPPEPSSGIWAVGTTPEADFAPPPPPPPGFASTAAAEGETLGSPIPPPPPPGFSASPGAETIVPPPPPGFAAGAPTAEGTFAVPIAPPPPPAYSAGGDAPRSLNGAHAAPPPPPLTFSPETVVGEDVFGAHAAPPSPPPVFSTAAIAGEDAFTVPPAPAPLGLSTKDMDLDEQWQAPLPPLPGSPAPEWPGDNLVWPPAAPPPDLAPTESLNGRVDPGSPGPSVLSSASFVADRGDAAPVPAAPAGFDPADLTGDFAIGAPTAPALQPNGFSPQELIGEQGLGTPPPPAPHGFSPQELIGEQGLGTPPPPVPHGFSPQELVGEQGLGNPPPPVPPGFSPSDLGGAFLPEDPPSPPPAAFAGPMATHEFDVGFDTSTSAPSTPPPGFDAAGETGDAPPPLVASAQSAFLPSDFVGNDALGGASAPPAKAAATKSTGTNDLPPLITPDFFARAGRRKR